MRYDLDQATEWFAAVALVGNNRGAVHVFRDNELDGLAREVERQFSEFKEDDDGFVIFERLTDIVTRVLRNHASERQPGSPDGAG